MWKLEKGDIVNCIVAEAGELTEGKKYKILNVNSRISQVEIINDKKEKKSYLSVRFDKEELWVHGL